VEARLLAQPVSFELASTAHAEGIEDRTTMAPLAATRLADMAKLGRMIVAIELAVAAQATELRGLGPLGRRTAGAHAAVRSVIPFRRAGEPMIDLAPLVEMIATGALTRS
jgi:histidine ammonia-lyase